MNTILISLLTAAIAQNLRGQPYTTSPGPITVDSADYAGRNQAEKWIRGISDDSKEKKTALAVINGETDFPLKQLRKAENWVEDQPAASSDQDGKKWMLKHIRKLIDAGGSDEAMKTKALAWIQGLPYSSSKQVAEDVITHGPSHSKYELDEAYTWISQQPGDQAERAWVLKQIQ